MNPLTAKDIARLISESVAASLAIALEQGACDTANLASIAKAIGGNAAAVLHLELSERGLADE
jgi:hypothetical protein